MTSKWKLIFATVLLLFGSYASVFTQQFTEGYVQSPTGEQSSYVDLQTLTHSENDSLKNPNTQLTEFKLKPVEILAKNARSSCFTHHCPGISYIVHEPIPPSIPSVPEDMAHGIFFAGCSGYAPTGQLPLYVLDGVPLEANINPLDLISPDQIKELTILKPHQLQMFCSSTRNVILITTKNQRREKDHISYNGLAGVGKLWDTPQAPYSFAQQHELGMAKNVGPLSIKSSANFRQLPLPQGESYRQQWGANLGISSKSLVKGRLHLNTLFSFQQQTQAHTVPTANRLRSAKPHETQSISMNNHFARAYASYQFSDAWKGSMMMSQYQSDQLYLQGLMGSLVRPTIQFEKKISGNRRLKAELALPRSQFQTKALGSFTRLGQYLDIDYTLNAQWRTRIVHKQSQGNMGTNKQPLAYRNTGSEIRFDSKDIDIDLDILGICAYSRTQVSVLGSAGITQSPLANLQTMGISIESSWGRATFIDLSYVHNSTTDKPYIQAFAPEMLVYFPELYDDLAYQGLSLSVDHSFSIAKDLDLQLKSDYCRGSGIAQEMFTFNGRLSWKNISLHSSWEGIRGWQLSNQAGNFSRLSFLNLKWEIPNLQMLRIEKAQLTLSSQNLFTSGNRQVLRDQIAFRQIRNPSISPFVLSRNLMLGINLVFT